MEEIPYKILTVIDDPFPINFNHNKNKPQKFMGRLIKDIITLQPDQAIVVYNGTTRDIYRIRTNSIHWFRLLNLPYTLEIITIKTASRDVAFVYKRVTKKIAMGILANESNISTSNNNNVRVI